MVQSCKPGFTGLGSSPVSNRREPGLGLGSPNPPSFSAERLGTLYNTSSISVVKNGVDLPPLGRAKAKS